MANYHEWIQHKGKDVLFAKLSGLGEEEYFKAVDELESVFLGKPDNSKILMLLDVTGSRMTAATRDRGKEMGNKSQAKGIITITTIVGISGIQKIIAQAISKDVHYSKTVDEAKDWLVQQ
ncbi:MAG: hypothetical protein JEZ06_19960 [Anaerolineaceae bacterium]|nr:hypothetical protein [Anaerolineaceae bacterium]